MSDAILNDPEFQRLNWMAYETSNAVGHRQTILNHARAVYDDAALQARVAQKAFDDAVAALDAYRAKAEADLILKKGGKR